MLDRDQRTLERLHKLNIPGGLLPTVTLLSDLTRFLNGAKTKTGKKVALILEKMLELEAMAKPIKGPIIAAIELKRTDPQRFKQVWEIEKKRAILQSELARYHFIPHADVFFGGEATGPTQWVTWWGRVSSEADERDFRLSPSQALEAILRLAEMGYLSRLKRCARCQKWLYARSRQQSFCALACQQKQYTQTDEWRAHRRQYMRQYYRQTYGRVKASKS